MSSVPYTGSIVGNLSLSACLAATSAASGLAFWYRNPAEGEAPSWYHVGLDRSDILLASTPTVSALTGLAATAVFAQGVACPCWERGCAAAGRAYGWVKGYQSRLDGSAAMSCIAGGGLSLAAGYVPPPYGTVASGVAIAAGALYLYSKPDSIIPPPPLSPTIPDFDPSAGPMDIKPGNPLHIDEPFLIEFPSDKTVELKTPAAAFIAMMCKPEYVKKNASDFMNKNGDSLRKDFELKAPPLQSRMLNEKHALSNPDLGKHRRELMLHLLRHKFGLGSVNKPISEEQDELRTALKLTEGKFNHPKFGDLLDSDTMTSLMQKCLKEIVVEDRTATMRKPVTTTTSPGVRFASAGSSSSATGYPAATRYTPIRELDDSLEY